MSDSRPTLRQIATRAGVSAATVSLALRNHPSLPPATRERLQTLAREMGYTQDAVVASLMSRLRTKRVQRGAERIAYLTSWSTAEGWREHANSLRYFEGATARAEALGYELEHVWSKEPRLTQARLSQILYSRGIRGVIIAPLVTPRGHASLVWEHFCCVTVGYSLQRPAVSRVAHSHYDGMQLALRELRRRGYRRVGFATLESEANRVNRLWLGSFLANTFVPRAETKGRPAPEPLLLRDMDATMVGQWLEREQVDAVVSNLDMEKLILKLGLRVPADIGYACLDLPEGRNWAGINQLPFDLGEGAVNMVVRRMQTHEYGIPSNPVLQLLNGCWQDGPSVRQRQLNK